MGNAAQSLLGGLMGGASTAPPNIADLQNQWLRNKKQLDQWGLAGITGSSVYNNVKSANDKLGNQIRQLGAVPGVLK